MNPDSRVIIPKPVLTGEVVRIPRPAKALPDPDRIRKADKEALYKLSVDLLDKFPADLKRFVDFPGRDAFDGGAEKVLSAIFCKVEANIRSHFTKEEQNLKKTSLSRIAALKTRIDKEQKVDHQKKNTEIEQLKKECAALIEKTVKQIKYEYALKIKKLESPQPTNEQLSSLLEEDKKIKKHFEMNTNLIAKKQEAYLLAISDLRRFYKIHSD
jgi:hypothetical protein